MAQSDSRRKKLQMLTRSLARKDIKAAQEAICADQIDPRIGYRRYEPENPLSLAHACAGEERTVGMPMGTSRFWLINRTLEQVSPASRQVALQFAGVMRGARQRVDELEASVGLCHAADGGPEDLLFMDVESCGFSGAVIFLVGMMYYRNDDLHFEQYLARNYAEEAAILTAFIDRVASARVLVTFNGKAFDMNMIRERAIFHGLKMPPEGPHLDLLTEARKRWRGRLPNCKLQTLERHLFKRNRVGDIPGWAIADAYHKFVDTADARQVRDIVHHNLLDLLTMAQLVSVILTGEDPMDA
ncbi:MAG: hypothetical protein GXY38_09490 [Planctomycetes bacterium]|jgi:uncharacterized protein YprB with RNaseH-like and TPR domain|nr:hypothetical protein [Planctomycetota bacterium]